MYETVTRGIRVRVTPAYMEDQSTPEENYFFWMYTVVIENAGSDPVQLRSRVWHITDADGHTEEVRGPGVVGQTPLIPPGETFTYTSGCPLRTPQGIMVGAYQMVNAQGDSFSVAIPAFSLDSPFARRNLN